MKNWLYRLLKIVAFIYFFITLFVFLWLIYIPGNKIDKVIIKDSTVAPTKKEIIKAPFEIKTDQDGLTINVTKIENDDVLKVYVEYENNTGQKVDLTTSLCKIVADGKQQDEPNDAFLDLNSDPFYELENGVEYEQIIPFDKIKSNTFNLVLVCNYEEYRVNDIIVSEVDSDE